MLTVKEIKNHLLEHKNNIQEINAYLFYHQNNFNWADSMKEIEIDFIEFLGK